ncbi:MAG: ribonuclease [Acetobacteraceae bacterium]|nr:ribonuclease [Acetobacteraceae bacterium]
MPHRGSIAKGPYRVPWSFWAALRTALTPAFGLLHAPVYKPRMARPTHPQYPTPVLISTTKDLDALCQRMRRETFVTVDTEFMRERTYWPELCLVQIAGEHEVAVIDAQAEAIDLASLGALFADEAVTKVFHAARQDIEIFVLRFGDVPHPMFDTQVAAMVAGFGDQVGYDALVSSLTGGTIDKAHRFSDWSVRPLSSAQITYAAADVTHLRDVYVRLSERLERDNRLSWVAEEMAILNNPATYRTDPETAWERLRPRSTNRRFLHVLKEVAAWREKEAQRVNVPRQRLIKDEALLEIAATAPTDPDTLARVRGVTRGFAEGRSGTALLDALAAARQVSDADLPAAPPSRDAARPSAALVALLKVLLAAKSEQHHVAPRLVGSSDDIDRLALEDAPDIPAMHGWRREVFGNDALLFKQGRIALGVDGRRVKFIPV